MQQVKQQGMFSAFGQATTGLFQSIIMATTTINRTVNAFDNVVQVGERTAVAFNKKHEITTVAELAALKKQLDTIDQSDREAAQAILNSI